MPVLNSQNSKLWKFAALKKVLYLSLLVLLVSSCGTNKYLTESQSLLKKNNIEINSDQSRQKKVKLQNELRLFLRQTPNTRWLLLWPREWFYFVNSQPGDSSWYHNWGRNSIGELPAIYSEEETHATAQSMFNYLRNRKGYYEALVAYSVETKDKKSEVTYDITPGHQYFISNIKYVSEDTAIIDVINNLDSKISLVSGQPMDGSLFDAERQRVAKELQNLGYANFSSSYITVEGDSTNAHGKVSIELRVNPPSPDLAHQKYRVGLVNVFTDYTQGDPVTMYNDGGGGERQKFFKKSEEFIVKPSRLSQSIYLKPGEFYKKDRQNLTFKKLSELHTYKFITISPIVESQRDSTVDFNVYLVPHKNSWVSDFGVNAFYSSISSVGRKLFGFSVGESLENRNFLKGAELFSIDGELGYEFEVNPKIRTSAITGTLQANLEIPKLVDLLNTGGTFNKLGLISDERHTSIKENTKSRLTLSYTRSNIIDFYDIRSLSLSYSYDYRPSSYSRYLFRAIGLNLNSYNLEDLFIDRIEGNPFIVNSFESSLFTGVFFRSLTYFYQSPKKGSGRSWANITDLELSGWEILLANKLTNQINGKDDRWRLSDRFEFAKFVRLDVDTRYYTDLGKRSALASRFNIGIALPLDKDQVIPYTKQFYVGGPNSIRAWQIRELGPGANSTNLINPVQDQLFYQQGDIKLEFNLEYRFDLFWLLEGALFLDGGNVWTRKEDPDRPGANFTTDFYKQIALGSGWGLRWDFVYFNIRFDFGYRIRNPFPNPETGSYWLSHRTFKFLGNVNIAVNYPF